MQDGLTNAFGSVYFVSVVTKIQSKVDATKGKTDIWPWPGPALQGPDLEVDREGDMENDRFRRKYGQKQP